MREAGVSLVKRKFLTTQQDAQIVAAIEGAERGNRGEIRVHLEAECKGDALLRARSLFAQLDMVRTAADTGILLYVAHRSRKVAVFAGEGIHAATDEAIWSDLVERVARECAVGNEVEGVCAALDILGELLRYHLASADRHGDELPNQVTTS